MTTRADHEPVRPNQLFSRAAGNPILDPAKWPYTVNSVFNPGVTRAFEEFVLLVRVEDRSGRSHLTVARSHDGENDWRIDARPSLLPSPDVPEERWGLEDPRITTFDDGHVIVYTALSSHGPQVRMARTSDFTEFEPIGTVTPPENKDAALFPVRFDGRYALIHRPISSWLGGGAHIWISFSSDLKYWGEPRILMASRPLGHWDREKIGLGPPPLRTPEGWLLMFHGVRATAAGLLYRAGLALLDLDDPSMVLARSDEWVLGPEAIYERTGDVPGVVFPTGWAEDDDGTVMLYYGAADSVVAMARARTEELVRFVRRHSI
jgi:predicted GH43/DUF377 family glycosyl hydrolase